MEAAGDRQGGVGDTRIVGAHVWEGEDSHGEQALFVDLTLSTPRGDTWPVEDIWALRHVVRHVISGVGGVEIPWFIRFAPQDAGQLDPEDIEDQITV
jgi:hypothetical protein